MEQRFNKPRVFLSHSKKDSSFIEKLADDLRKCQIDPWLDTYEIRHGKSWLDSIFEYGLPTCDAIMVYFTESSLSSSVVKKEMDVGILQKLSDNNVAFLPYVNDTKIRTLLRPDIQALQTPEWNDSNYNSLLPRVVAEIWRSYLERTIAVATKDERLKRVEAELALEKARNQREDFFSLSENTEFDFIWSSYNIMIPVTIIETRTNPHTKDQVLTKSHELIMNPGTVIATLTNQNRIEYDPHYVKFIVRKLAIELLDISLTDENIDAQVHMKGFPELTEQLLMYGLIENFSYPATSHVSTPYQRNYLEHNMVFSKKYFRFRYWLAHHQKLPDSVVMEIVKNT